MLCNERLNLRNVCVNALDVALVLANASRQRHFVVLVSVAERVLKVLDVRVRAFDAFHEPRYASRKVAYALDHVIYLAVQRVHLTIDFLD